MYNKFSHQEFVTLIGAIHDLEPTVYFFNEIIKVVYRQQYASWYMNLIQSLNAFFHSFLPANVPLILQDEKSS